MTDSEFIRLFTDLFAGREDAYAIWFESHKEDVKGFYSPSTYESKNPDRKTLENWVNEITEDIGSKSWGEAAVESHMMGEHFLGVYPLRSDSKVNFFALDFDKEPLEAWREAVDQQRIFAEEAGIPTYIERSRSGNGYHLWGFLEEPVKAGAVRHALEPFIYEADTYDRMFPHQDEVNNLKPFGNLIALPLYGPNVPEGGVFVEVDPDNADTPVVVDQREFLSSQIEKISKRQIHHLFDEREEQYVPPREVKKRELPPGELTGAWLMAHPEFGCEWIRWAYEHPQEVSEPAWYVLACQFAQFENGRDLFHEWSEQDPSRYDPSATDQKFDHALEANAPQTCEYIREQGFGPGCYCDERFPDHRVYHPFDIAEIPFSDLIDSVEEEHRIEHAADGLIDVIYWAEEIQNNPELGKGWEYGIDPIDEVTGLRRGDLIVLGARPGMGKTALMIDVADNLASKGIPAYVFSLEMKARMLWLRLLAKRAEIDSKKVLEGTLTPEDWKRIGKAGDVIKELGSDYPFFCDDVTVDSPEIVDITGELMSQHGPGVVFVDYLQLAKRYSNEDQRTRTERVVSQYRLLAKRGDIPVFALVQLNRTADDATSESETFDSWIRESGQVEQDASVIMFLLGPKVPGKVVDRSLVVHKERYTGGHHRLDLQFNKAQSAFGGQGTWDFVSRDRHDRMGGDSGVPVLNKNDLMKHIVGDNDLFGGLE